MTAGKPDVLPSRNSWESWTSTFACFTRSSAVSRAQSRPIRVGVRHFPARDAHISHKVKAPRANNPRGLHVGAPCGIRTSGLRIRRGYSRIVKFVQGRASRCKYGKCVRRESQDVRAHASSSKDVAGSLLYGLSTESEVLRTVRPLLSVRQVAKLLGVCAATVYTCEQGGLPHFRVLNAIRMTPRP